MTKQQSRSRSKRTTGPLSYPKLIQSGVHEVVRQQLGQAKSVHDVAAAIEASPLSLKQKHVLIDQALVLFENFYVHLPLKRAMHAVDPVQRLKLLRLRAHRFDDEWRFHREMLTIFNSVRDLHTNYILPAPFSNFVAYLPFKVEKYFSAEDQMPRYLVTQVVTGLQASDFVRGVEIITWNGIPIHRAVQLVANQHAGSNNAARHARGVEALTIRPLVASLPPDEEWLIVTYLAADGQEREIRLEWMVFEPKASDFGGNLSSGVKPTRNDSGDLFAQGLDIESDLARRASKMLFAPHVIEADRRFATREGGWPQSTWPDSGWPDSNFPGRKTRSGWPASKFPISHWPLFMQTSAGRINLKGSTSVVRGSITTSDGDLDSEMPSVFNARAVLVDGEEFGYVRIRTFNVNYPESFVAEFIRLISLLPQTGLIIDVRDNGGGNIIAGERLLQTLTPRTIQPTPVQFINSQLNLDLCKRHGPSPLWSDFDLKPWRDSIRQSIETAAVYSRGFPITSVDAANDIGQQYHGPVVLVTNARCYSTTDIFAAGFQDHKIGTILGVDDNTGAGGANVWTHSLLDLLWHDPNNPRARLPTSPFVDLPKGVAMRIAIRRTLRVEENLGTPVEDLGILPDKRHNMTKEDLLNRNVDLIAAAARIIARKRTYKLDVELGPADASNKVIVTLLTKNLSRVDVFIDQVPFSSEHPDARKVSFSTLQLSDRPQVLDFQGYYGKKLAASRRIVLDAAD